MKVLNKKQVKTLYEIELKQEEVDVLTAAMGKTSEWERIAVFVKYGVPIPDDNETNVACGLYELFKKISSFSK